MEERGSGRRESSHHAAEDSGALDQDRRQKPGEAGAPVATVLELLQFSWLGALVSDKENQLP